MFSQNKSEGGFTVLEIMTIIFIIAILIAMIIPVFLGYRARGYDAQAKSKLRIAISATQAFYIDHDSTYTNMNATTLNQIVEGVSFRDGAVSTDVDVYIVNVSETTFKLDCRSRSGTVYSASGNGTQITYDF